MLLNNLRIYSGCLTSHKRSLLPKLWPIQFWLLILVHLNEKVMMHLGSDGDCCFPLQLPLLRLKIALHWQARCS
jgi:hypothetical protein